MTCREAMRRSIEGTHEAAVREHLAGCEPCRRVLSHLETAAVPDARVMAGIKSQIASSWRPVKARPSLKTLRLALLSIFVAFCVAFPALLGYGGFHALTLGQKTIYFGLLLACSVGVGDAVIRAMSPGSKLLVNYRTLLISVGLALAVWALLQFPFVVTRPFILGDHCLAAGLITAAISSLVLVPFFWNAVPGNVVSACTGMGFFCGLAGTVVLAFHCPVQASPHILVWHLTVLPIAAAVGAAIGFSIQSFQDKKYSALHNS